MRFPGSDDYPCVRFRSRLYPVWIPASGPYRLSRRLTSGCPDAPWCTPPDSAPALHRSYDHFTHFRVGEGPPDEASAIGSVSLSMTDLPAGPLGIGSPLTPGFNGFC